MSKKSDNSSFLKTVGNKAVDLGQQTFDLIARRFVGRTVQNAIGYTAASIILTARGLMKAWDLLLDWALKPIGKGLEKVFPGPCRWSRNAYNYYTNSFKKIGYPHSVYAMIGLGGVAAGGTIWATIGTKDVMYAQLMGEEVANAAQRMAVYTFAPKISKIFVFKPALITGKTTIDGFFKSDLYQEKLKPAYKKAVEPAVLKTQEIIADVDVFLEKTPTPYKLAKDIFKDQENGGLIQRAKDIADDPSKDLRWAFEQASDLSKRALQNVKDITGITPYNEVQKRRSKLDDKRAQNAFKSADQQGVPENSKTQTDAPKASEQDHDLV